MSTVERRDETLLAVDRDRQVEDFGAYTVSTADDADEIAGRVRSLYGLWFRGEPEFDEEDFMVRLEDYASVYVPPGSEAARRIAKMIRDLRKEKP